MAEEKEDISTLVFNKLDITIQESLKIILEDIGARYEINMDELEGEYLDNGKKKKNGYNRYNSKRRKEMLEENPDIEFGEMSKIIGNEWRNLSEKDKKKYQ